MKGINYYGCGPAFTNNFKSNANLDIDLKGLTKLLQVV